MKLQLLNIPGLDRIAATELKDRSTVAVKGDAEEAAFSAFGFFQPVGITISIGKVKGSDNWAIHSVSFDKEAYDLVSARKWLDQMSFWGGDEFKDTRNEFTYEIRAKDNFDPSTIKRIERPKSFAELKDFKDPAPNSGRIDGVEIFRTGKWNGENYTTKDLQDIVAAAEGVGFNPPVKLGHQEKSGGMAYGWVENIRIEFDNAKKSAARLVADFVDVPKEIVSLIKERRFDAVSSEIFWNFKRNGKLFRRVLKAVALLGAETPGVGDLKPLHGVVEFGESSWDGIHAYTVQPKRRAKMTLKTLADCTARLTALTAEIAEEQDAEKLAALYAEQSEVSGKIVELSAKPPKSKDKAGEGDDEGDGGSASVDAVDFKKMQDDMEAMRTELAASGERERAARVEAKVKDLRVPSLRDHVAALYDLASRSDTQVRFFISEDDKGEKKYGDVAAIKVIDDLVARINKSTERLFTTLGHTGDFKRDDEPAAETTEDAGAELSRLTSVYMAKHDIKDYSAAFKLVCDDPDNAELKRQYAEAS